MNPRSSVQSSAAVRVFIGSGETSVLERKVLIRTLRAHTRRPLDICVFNGTHNALEWNAEPPTPAPMSLEIKYRNYTEFSLYRFLIPELCGFRGKAIYMDSDMLCFADMGTLFDLDMQDLELRCVSSLYGEGTWATSVMLINCELARFDLRQILAGVDAGIYGYHEFMRFAPAYRDRFPLRIGALDRRWNCFDEFTPESRILHYTDTYTQPWRFPDHPFGALWYEELRDALTAGEVTQHDLNRAIALGYAGAFLPGKLRPRVWLQPLRRALRRFWNFT
jgi:hypothetical protein